MNERRATDREKSNILSRASQTTQLLRALAIGLAIYFGLAVTIASVIGVANSFQALEQAKENGDIGALIRSCVVPAKPGQPETQCSKDSRARTGEAVRAIVDADGNGVVDAIEVRDALTRIEKAVTR